MIVRISGEGQYELDDSAAHRLEALDDRLTDALHAGDEQGFHQHLHEVIAFVREEGKAVAPDQVVPSQVIIPPDDVTMSEAQTFFLDDGQHMHPVSA
jgi:hypothetical protein